MIEQRQLFRHEMPDIKMMTQIFPGMNIFNHSCVKALKGIIIYVCNEVKLRQSIRGVNMTN